MLEQWKPIKSFEGKYEVSSFGRVRSLRASPPLVLKVALVSGYERVHLMKDGDSRYILVHRLVLEAFCGPCPDKFEASHLDGDKRNNRRTNLAWESRSDNHRRKVEHGTAQKGSRNGQSKLTESQIPKIRRLLAQRVSMSTIAGMFQVSPRAIRHIKQGRAWAHVLGAKP